MRKINENHLNEKKIFKRVLHEIFKRNRNIIKKHLRTPILQPLLHLGPKRHQTNMEKINVNDKFQ